METGWSGLGSSLIGLERTLTFDTHTKTDPIHLIFRLGGCLTWCSDIGAFYLLDAPPIRTNQRWRDLLPLALWSQTGCIKIARLILLHQFTIFRWWLVGNHRTQTRSLCCFFMLGRWWTWDRLNVGLRLSVQSGERPPSIAGKRRRGVAPTWLFFDEGSWIEWV